MNGDAGTNARGGEAEGLNAIAALLRDRRLILFDLDDTLCDFSRARELRLRRAIGDAAAAAGVSLDADRLEALVRRSIEIHPHSADHFPDLLSGEGIGASAAVAAQAWFRGNRFHGLALFEATRLLVRHLRALTGERQLGVVTNGPAEVQRSKVELLGVDRLVDFVIISGEFGTEKPDPAIFRAALERAGVLAGDAVFVGDDPVADIEGARGVGMDVVWVSGGHLWPGPGVPPQHVVPGIDDMLRVLTGEDV